MHGYGGPALLMVLAMTVVGGLQGLAWLVGLARAPLRAAPWSGGELPAEHALSRYHARWYSMTLVFLAFDLEMLFMYPWAVIVAQVGATAVIEMFGFLLLLMVGVLYAWREGAFRWA